MTRIIKTENIAPNTLVLIIMSKIEVREEESPLLVEESVREQTPKSSYKSIIAMSILGILFGILMVSTNSRALNLNFLNMSSDLVLQLTLYEPGSKQYGDSGHCSGSPVLTHHVPLNLCVQAASNPEGLCQPYDMYTLVNGQYMKLTYCNANGGCGGEPKSSVPISNVVPQIARSVKYGCYDTKAISAGYYLGQSGHAVK